MSNNLKLTLLKTIRVIVRFLKKTKITELAISKKIYDSIIPKLVPKSIELDGHRIFLDSKDFAYLSTKQFEPFEKEIIEKIVKPGDVVLDLGANIGYYTLLLARKVGDKGKVFTFEPDPYYFNLLKKNVKENHYKNVVLANKVVFNKNGKIKLQTFPDQRDSPKVYGEKQSNDYIGLSTKDIAVEMVRLDDYLKNVNTVDFVKIDIEGSEGMAFAGMIKLVRRSKNIKITTEFYPRLLNDYKVDAKTYAEMLFNEKFALYKIDEHGKRLERIKNKKKFMAEMETKEYFTNLLCLKGNEHICLGR